MLRMIASVDEKKFRRFAKEFGDSSEQALIRVGVAAAREAAVLTSPPGRSKKKVVEGIVTGARVNIADVPARRFNELAKRQRPGFKFGRQWVTLRREQLLQSQEEVNEFIEGHRDKRGRVRKLNSRDRAVCKTGDMNKTLVRRKRLAGVAKGAWLGAGKSLARKARGAEQPRIGKNFMTWAQKHTDKGTSALRRRALRGSVVTLISRARHAGDKGVWSEQDGRQAVERAWRKTLGYYRRTVRRRAK